MKRIPSLPDEAVTEEAAAFAIDDEEQRSDEQLVSWLTESPEHVAEYMRVSALWEALADPNVAAAMPEKRFAFRDYRRAIAAAAAVIILASATWWAVARPPVHSTVVGEVKSFPLPDRSVVFLNAESRLSVEYSDAMRRVVLQSGEAVFDVAPDVARPFVVACGTTTVTAVGTKFAVSRRSRETVVTLIEGRVVVAGGSTAGVSALPSQQASRARRAAVTLSPGDRLTMNEDDGSTVARVDPAQVAPWRLRRLVFESERLVDVAAEFNRFNERPIHVEGEGLRELRITGVFDANDPNSLLTFLRSRDGVEVVMDADGSATVRPPR